MIREILVKRERRELPGEPGVNGTAGADGSDGATGPKGDTGAAGAAGAAGTDGAPGTKGDNGDTGAQGPQGAAGAQGPQGATGAQGPAGNNVYDFVIACSDETSALTTNNAAVTFTAPRPFTLVGVGAHLKTAGEGDSRTTVDLYSNNKSVSASEVSFHNGPKRS